MREIPEVPATIPDEDLGPGSDCRGIPKGPLQLTWRLDFPEAPRVSPRGPRCNSRGTPILLPQLEKNQEILPSTKDEAPFCCSILREIPSSLLSFKKVIDNLEGAQEVPRQNLLHSKGTPRVLPQLKKSPGLPSSSREEGPFPASSVKGSWHAHQEDEATT